LGQEKKEKIRFEEMYYGVLVMVVCDSEGIVYDLWFHPASYHGVRSLRIRYRKSKGHKAGGRGCKFTEIKFFNRVSRWRKGITLLAYLYSYAIGYSFFRKSHIWE